MSSNHNKFLLSSCLPIMASSILMASNVHAGFEWIPAPQKETVMVQPETTVTPEPVQSVEIFETETVPVIHETPAPVTVITSEPTPMPVEIHTPVAQAEPIPMPMETAKPVTNQNAAPTEISKPMNIDPYPLDNKQPRTIATMDPIALPANEEIELAELTVENVNPTPVVETPTVIASAEDAVTWNTSGSYEIIEGFGTDMPLALALRQIVPANYAFSFGDDVNPGKTVSWKGGEPWNIVLQDALDPIGMTFQIKGKKLILKSTGMHQSAQLTGSPQNIQAAQDPLAPMPDVNDSMVEGLKKKLK